MRSRSWGAWLGCVAAVPSALCVAAAEEAPTIRPLDLEAFATADDPFRPLGISGLHVGCGLALPAGALNSDVEGIAVPGGGRSSATAPLVAVDVPGASSSSRYFLEHDARLPFPFRAGAFDWVFAEHFVEHVDRAAAVAFLAEARRLLPARRGGVVRLATPDLALYARGLYASADAQSSSPFLEARRAAMTTGPMAGANAHLRAATPAALLNDLFRSYGHLYIYDFDELVAVAAEAGLLAPRGDCVAERSLFNHSSHVPDVAHALDDPVKAYESLYVDLVCGELRYASSKSPPPGSRSGAPEEVPAAAAASGGRSRTPSTSSSSWWFR